MYVILKYNYMTILALMILNFISRKDTMQGKTGNIYDGITLKPDWQDKEFEFQTIIIGETSEMFDQQIEGAW